jgi:protein SCO1/2
MSRRFVPSLPAGVWLAAVLLNSVLCNPALAQNHAAAQNPSRERPVDSPLLDRDAALKFSMAAVGTTPADRRFTNQDNQAVALTRYRGKPLLVNFIYTSCYHTCPTMTSHIKDVLKIARNAVGADTFAIVSIGFDYAADSPGRMRYFAEQRKVDFAAEHWDFLSGDRAAIEGIARDLGFRFVTSPNGFDHLAQTTLIDAEGKVYRQIYGADFQPPAMVEPLKELIFGIDPQANDMRNWLNGIKLFCTIYDPAANRYYFDYSIFIMIAIGVACLSWMAYFVIRSWRETSRAS